MKTLLPGLLLLLLSGAAITPAAAQQPAKPAKPRLETANKVERQETHRLRHDERTERREFRQDGRATTEAHEASRRQLEPRPSGPRKARP